MLHDTKAFLLFFLACSFSLTLIIVSLSTVRYYSDYFGNHGSKQASHSLLPERAKDRQEGGGRGRVNKGYGKDECLELEK